MEMGCIGFLLGAIACLVFVGLGVCIGDRSGKGRDNGQSVSDNDVRIYVYSRDRNRNRNRHRMERFSKQEMIFVLHNLKRLTHGWERDIIDAMIEEKEGSEK